MSTTYEISIVVNGQDNASGPLGNVGFSLGSMGNIIGGILTAGLLTRFAQGIMDIGREALDSYTNFERMSASLNALVAREMMNDTAVTKTTQTMRQATQAEIDRANWLQKSIAIEEKKLSVMTAGSDAYIKETDKIGKMQMELSNLTITSDGYILSTETSTQRTMTMTEALEKSGSKTQDLIKWVEHLAIISPFSQEDVANSLQMGMSYGFTSDQAKRLVTDLGDYAAATGKTGEVIQRMMMSLGQMNAAGKLTGMEIRELAIAGLPVKQILADALHVTTGELDTMIRKGAIPAKQAFEILASSIEKDFGGSMERQAGTMAGLMTSLEDLKTIRLREFFESTFKAIQPYVQKFVDAMQDPETIARINAIGKSLGNVTAKVLGFLSSFNMDALNNMLRSLLGDEGFKQLQILGENIAKTFGDMSAAGGQLSGGLLPTLQKIASILIDAFVTNLKFINDNWEAFSAVLKAIGIVVVALGAILLGLGVVIASVVQGGMEAMSSLVHYFKMFFGVLIQGIALYAAGFWATFGGLWDMIKSLFTGNWQGIADGFKRFVIGLVSMFAGLFVTIFGVVMTGVTLILAPFVWLYNVVVKIFKNLYDVLVGHSIVPDLMTKMLKVVKDGLKHIVKSFTDNLKSIADTIGKELDKMVKTWQDNWKQLNEIAQKLWDRMVSDLSDKLGDFLKIGVAIVTYLWNGVSSMWQAFVSYLYSIYTGIVNIFYGLVSWFYNLGSSIITSIQSGIGAFLSQLVVYLANMVIGIKGLFSSIGTFFYDVGKSIITNIKAGISEVWDAFIAWFQGIYNQITGTTTGGTFKQNGMQLGKNLMQGFADGIAANLSLPQLAFNQGNFAMAGAGSLSNYHYNSNDSSRKYYAPIYVTVSGSDPDVADILRSLRMR